MSQKIRTNIWKIRTKIYWCKNVSFRLKQKKKHDVNKEGNTGFSLNVCNYRGLSIYIICSQENRYEEKDNQSWVILGFTGINYLKVTKLWYKRLSDLGYENHLIVALDNASYQNIILQGNYRCEKTADYLQAVGFKSIVRLRLTTIAQYLE